MPDKGKSPQKGCVQGPWIDAELDDVHAALAQLVSTEQITLPEELRWTQDSGTILTNGEVSGVHAPEGGDRLARAGGGAPA